MTARTYLDWNATTPLCPEARAAMIAAMDAAGNPSSVHAEGRAARALVEDARARIAAAIGCKPAEIVFTSGATEAARIMDGWPGPVHVDARAHDALVAHDRRSGAGPILRAQGLANSETGALSAITPVAGETLLVDLTQAVGRIPVAFGWSGADLGLFSAHKFGGPKGVGVLILREGLDLPPLSTGGGQEMRRRAGTENVIGIMGMAAALEESMAAVEAGIWDRVGARRDAMEAAIAAAVPQARIVAADGPRLPNTSCIIVPGWKGETQVMQMDLAGFAISAGSACSSGKMRPSRVLAAMGYGPTDAASAIRVSIGPDVTDAQLAAFVAAWTAAHNRHISRAA